MGIEGFGATRQLRSGPAEVAWDDLPAIVMAIDTCDAIHAVSGEVVRLLQGQTPTLSGTRILTESLDGLRRGDEPMELTIHCRLGDGRDDQLAESQGSSGELRRRGVAGATALIGVDGTKDGERRRGRLSAHSPELPALIIAVDRARVLAGGGGAAVFALSGRVADGEADRAVQVAWSPGPSRRADRPRAARLAQARRLHGRRSPPRQQATANSPRGSVAGRRCRRCGGRKGHLGFALGDPIRPDPGWFAYRKASIVTTIVDTSDRVARWFELIDDLTGDDGFVTCERVTRLEAICDSDAEDSTEA